MMFMTYSWLDHKFSKSSWFFLEIFHLSSIYSQLLHIFFRTCSAHVHDLFTTFPQLVMNCSWLVHCLLLTCSLLVQPCSSGFWLVYDLFMSCSCFDHSYICIMQLVHVLLRTWTGLVQDVFIISYWTFLHNLFMLC